MLKKKLKNLKAQSAKNIQALENKILLDKKTRKGKIIKRLKTRKNGKIEKVAK